MDQDFGSGSELWDMRTNSRSLPLLQDPHSLVLYGKGPVLCVGLLTFLGTGSLAGPLGHVRLLVRLLAAAACRVKSLV